MTPRAPGLPFQNGTRLQVVAIETDQQGLVICVRRAVLSSVGAPPVFILDGPIMRMRVESFENPQTWVDTRVAAGHTPPGWDIPLLL